MGELDFTHLTADLVLKTKKLQTQKDHLTFRNVVVDLIAYSGANGAERR